MGGARLGDQRRHGHDGARGGQLHARPDPAHVPEARPAHATARTAGRRASTRHLRRSRRAPPPGCIVELCGGAHDAAADRRLSRPAAARAAAGAHGPRRAHHGARGVARRARSRSSTASASIRVPDRARSTCACRRPRFVDVTREIDVIEEIARIYGLEHVPSLLSVGSGGGLTARQRVRRTVADACLGAGLTEAQTLSLRARRTCPTASASAPTTRGATMLRGAQPALAGALAPAHAAPAEPARGAARATRPGAATTSRSSRSPTPTTRRGRSSCRASRGRSAP